MRRQCLVALAALCAACADRTDPTGLDLDPLLSRPASSVRLPGTYSSKVVRSRTATGEATSAALPAWGARTEWDLLVLFDGEAVRDMMHAGPGARSDLVVATDGIQTKVAVQVGVDGAGDVALQLVYREVGGAYRTVADAPLPASSFVAGEWYVLDAGLNGWTAWLDVTHFHSGTRIGSVREARSGSDAASLPGAVLVVSAGPGRDAGLSQATHAATARVQTVALGDGSRGPFATGSSAVLGIDPNAPGVDHYWPYAEGSGATVADVVGGAPLTYGGAFGADWYWIGGRNPSWDFNNGFPAGSTPVGNAIVEDGVLKLHREGADAKGTVRLNEDGRVLGLWWDEVHVIVGTDTDDPDQYLNPAHPFSGFASALRTDVGANQPPQRDLIAWSITHEKGHGPRFQVQMEQSSGGIVLAGATPLTDPVANGPFHVRIMGLGSTVQVDFLRLRSAAAPLDLDWQTGGATTGWTQAQLEGPRLGMRLSHKNPGPTVYGPGRYSYYEDLNARYVGLWSTTVVPPAPNLPPVAAFSAACTDLDCAFTDGSTDPDGSVVAWTWDFGDGNTSTMPSPTHTYGSAGTYTVSLTVTDDGGLPASTSEAVSPTAPNQPPVAAFTATCTDLDCTFTDASTDPDGSVVSWLWDFGDGATSTASSPTHTYVSAGTYTVTLTVTDDQGATGFSTQTVSPTPANVLPVAAFTATCTDLDCTFTDVSSDPDGAVVSWLWDFGDGATSTASSPTHTYVSAGAFTVTLTVTDDQGATGFAAQTVSPTPANVPPVAAFTASCIDLDCTFTDSSSDLDGSVVSWLWDFGDGATSTAASPSHAYAGAGTYTVTLNVADNAGGVASTSQSVSPTAPNQPPVAAFTASCIDLACTFTDASTDPDGSVVSWLWDFGDGATSTAASPTHAYAGAGTYTVTLNVADNAGGVASTSQAVSPTATNQPPVAAFTASCTDLDCAFTDASTDPDGAVVSWLWDFGDGSTSTAPSPTHTYVPAGTFTVTLTVTDDQGATGFAAQTVSPTPANVLPTAAFTATCTDLDCIFTDASTDLDGSVVSWLWDFGDGNTSTASSPTHTYVSAGTFTVTLTVADDQGATGFASQDVSPTPANVLPTAAFTASCIDLDCTFTDASSDLDGSVVSWLWDFGDGVSSTASSPFHAFSSPGTYTVRLSVADNAGGVASTSQAVSPTAPNQLPVAAFTASCTDLDCTFTDASSDPDGSVVSWLWDFGDGATSTASGPTHAYVSAGTFTVTLTITDDQGATGFATQTVSPTPANVLPTAAFTATCTDLDCVFTDASTDLDGSVVSWLWDFGDGNTSTAASPSHAYAGAGTYTVTLSVADNAGGVAATSQDVSPTAPNQSPVAAFTASCTDLDCTFTDASTDPDGSVVSWLWDFGDGNTSTAASPSHAYAGAGTYTVTLSVADNAGGVAATSQDVSPTAPNQSPVAAFTASCTDLDCTFTDAGTDPDGSVVSWLWDFGDGATSTASSPTHTYVSAATFTVSLTITDDQGATGFTSQDVSPTAPNQSPVAAFAASCTDLDCAFTDASSDSDGSVVSWLWDFGDGVSSTASSPFHTFSSPGTYTVTLNVADDAGGVASTSQSVSPTAPNQPPVAAFTASCIDLACTFTDVSTDPDGSVVSWLWDFGDGATSTAASPSHAYAGAGTYTVTLNVADNAGGVASTSQAVSPTAPNQPPVAAFTASCTDLDCSFTDASTDLGGSVVSWLWDFGDGATSTASSPTHTYVPAGTYTVTLTVTDDQGATGFAAQTVSPTPANVPPVAAFAASCTDLDCAFTDASTDPDGSVVSWLWDFGDGVSSTAASPFHAFSSPGTYTVTLSVADNAGGVALTSQSVSPTAPNQPPVAAFSASCTDLDCAFTDASTDPDGSVVSWLWDFGDGSTSTAPSPTHTYVSAATFTVSLTVTDDQGATGFTSQDVSPTAPNQSPVAAFTASCIDLACRFTDASTDPDGSVVSWLWDFGDGATSTAPSPTHTYVPAGTFTVTLTVTDDQGGTGFTSQSVSPTAPNQPPVAAFTATCTDLDCTFTDASTDPDGAVVSWLWDFGDGSTSTAPSPTHTYAGAGIYTVILTVTDDRGGSDSVTHPVAPAPNQAPSAKFQTQCSGTTCTFVDKSTDSDGTIVGWSWDFGNGASANTQNPSTTYPGSGRFRVWLTVTDNAGATSQSTDLLVCKVRGGSLECR